MDRTTQKEVWNEVKNLFNLMGQGKGVWRVPNLNQIQDLFYPIVAILRQEKEGGYQYRPLDKEVVVQTVEGEVLLRISASVFLDEAERLLEAINRGSGAFAIPPTERFMEQLHCHALKAQSTDKTDIRIILHDRRTKLNADMGFSIKSQLGGHSTLLNASQATNFTFRIKGVELSDEAIEQINALNPPQKKVLARLEAIRQKGGELVYEGIENDTFRNNLVLLDRDLPAIVANLLLEQTVTGISTLKELAERLNQTNPLHYDTSQGLPFYEYKIKHLLTSIALGMMPARAWDGRFDANGGYLVVKEDGEVVCYHFYDRNRFEDFLFANAYLERSSTTRHRYAVVVREKDGSLSFKLNFQVRLT